jgi:pimeloyl-ACP methyl ester carboxylesterase
MTAWVLLRGLTREARHWGGFPDVLRRTLPGDRVVTMDLPGCGQRRDRRSPARIETIVQCVREDLRRSGEALPVCLLGLSLGAMVAAEWASRHPDEVAACVLVNTSLRACSPFHQRLLPRSYPLLASLLLPGRTAGEVESVIYRLTSSGSDRRGQIVSAWADYRRECPVSRGDALRQLAAAARYGGGRSPPPVPTLLLASEGDRLVDCACSRAIAARWNAELRLHPRAGHDLPLDDAEWVAGCIRDWLRRSGEGARPG